MDDPTKTLAYIKFRSKLKGVCKVSTFKAGLVTIKIYDYGMEARDGRYYVTAETNTTFETSGANYYGRLEDALDYISWEKL